MKRSATRILTTHTGSLPRSDELLTLLVDREEGRPVDDAAFSEAVRAAVTATFEEERRRGLDVVNDGEMGRIGYSTYVKDRLTGFSGAEQSPPIASQDLLDFPRYRERLLRDAPLRRTQRPVCDGAIRYVGGEALAAELAMIEAARGGAAREDVFVTAASPGVIGLFLENRHYASEEQYLAALAEAMREEYAAIHRAGFTLQVDCPDLAGGWHMKFAELSVAEFRAWIALHIDVLNHALAGIPSEAVRMHICWGHYEGPHHRDVPLRDILDLILCAKPAGLSFECANPRHAHEWRLFGEVALPDEKVLIPGVIDSTTNFIEHPELVADRIERLASVVGRERVIAGVDCGFASFAGYHPVDPAIVWEKLGSLVHGALLASKRLSRSRS